MDKDNLFPQIKKGIEDFMKEEEGNISRSKVAMIGSMMVILGVMLADGNIYAAHRSHSSHSSHRSHSSHSSHSSHTSGSLSSHASHSSGSHSSHGSHSSGSHSSHSSGSSSSGGFSSGGSSSSGGSKYTVSLPKMQVPQATPDMNVH